MFRPLVVGAKSAAGFRAKPLAHVCSFKSMLMF
jgi:hypothetical protein